MLSRFKDPRRASATAPPADAESQGPMRGYDDAQPASSSEEKDLQPPNGKTRGDKTVLGPRVKTEGESGRSYFHPLHFLYCCFRSSSRVSMTVNFLWPLVPAAIAVHFALPDHHTLIFTLNYIAMVPAANLIGYAGQELGRKMPHAIGVIMETTLGSLVEVILFAVLVTKNNIPVVRAAIIGSILANLLFCLGACFIAGGLPRHGQLHHEQVFHEVISEVGSGLMLVAGMGLVLPVAFATATSDFNLENNHVLDISRATAILLLVAFAFYVFFNLQSHHGIVTEVLESDELNDRDRHQDLTKQKLTLTECALALLFAIACVSLIAVFLVLEIEYIVEDRGVSDAFMGIILVPFVEKFAEHLTAIDEAYDGMPNVALAHVLGASVQTALLNCPIVVIIGWGLHVPMDLNFKLFEAVSLILSILVLGNFLRDGKANYLEGVLCILIYVIIAVCAWYYPNEVTDSGAGVEAGARAVKALLKGT